VDFGTVSTVGLESSPVAAALAGLRANEARYFRNKYDHDFTVAPSSVRADRRASPRSARRFANSSPSQRSACWPRRPTPTPPPEVAPNARPGGRSDLD
jgi:hypothetical protein